MSETIDKKFNNIYGKIIGVAVSLALTIGGFMYSDMKARVTVLEEKVSFLYQDKVSRAEFREEMNQIRMQNEANKTDILSRQESTKSDILARMDLYFSNQNYKREN